MVIVDNMNQLLYGLRGTVILMFSTIGIAIVLSIPLAFFRDSKWIPLRAVIEVYSWVFRCTPALVVLFFMYYGLPAIGIHINAWAAAIVALSLTATAYMTEIVRGGIRAVPQNQWDSARALGIPATTAMRKIIFPQAMRVVTPALFSNFTVVLKDSTLASLVAVHELTGQAMNLISATYKPVEILFFVAVVYLLLNSMIIAVQIFVETYFSFSR